jgi:hypothetical protein
MKLTNVSVFILATLLSCTALGMAAAPARQSFGLRMVIVVSRHGVRSPTHPDLTDRGALLMRQSGAA